MKKIIATVLAMVMALALCTTAFAVTTTYAGDKVGTETYKTTDDATLSLEKFSTGSADSKTFDTYKLWLTTTKTGAKTEATGYDTQYWLATADCYDMVFVNGTSITYLLTANTSASWAGKAEAVAVVKGDAKDAKCGEYYSSTGATIYAYDGYVYDAAATGKLVNVDGKALYIADTATTLSATEKLHSYKMDTAKVDGKTTVTKVYCKNTDCTATFEFVVGSVSDATAKFGAGYFEDTGLDVGTDNVYVKTGSASASGSSTTTTTSPKTFDAGIAMYVGMALTSVAGSAVVIGKKKEF